MRWRALRQEHEKGDDLRPVALPALGDGRILWSPPPGCWTPRAHARRLLGGRTHNRLRCTGNARTSAYVDSIDCGLLLELQTRIAARNKIAKDKALDVRHGTWRFSLLQDTARGGPW